MCDDVISCSILSEDEESSEEETVISKPGYYEEQEEILRRYSHFVNLGSLCRLNNLHYNKFLQANCNFDLAKFSLEDLKFVFKDILKVCSLMTR